MLLAGGAETYRMVKRYLTRSGGAVWAQLTVALARDTHGAPLYFISMIEDVTAERDAHEALVHQAAHDELTGLANRATLLAATARGARPGAAPASGRWRLLFCDLDHFKLVNDSRGHEAGDAVLVETAERLRACIRDGDTGRPARRRRVRGAVRGAALARRTPSGRPAADRRRSPSRCTSAADVTMTVSIGIALVRARASPRPSCCATPTPRCTGPRRAAATGTPCSCRS